MAVFKVSSLVDTEYHQSIGNHQRKYEVPVYHLKVTKFTKRNLDAIFAIQCNCSTCRFNFCRYLE